MRRIALIAALLFLVPGAALAQRYIIAVDLAEDHIDITTGFNGARLVLFGRKEQGGEIAVVFMGPRREMTVREKGRIGGVWLNTASRNFENVPVYYDYALSEPEDEFKISDDLRAALVGVEALRFPPKDKKAGPEVEAFQDALIRNRQAEGLFPKEAGDIKFIDDHLFRATLLIPPNVPTGAYEIKTYLVERGKIRAEKTMQVRVAQVGMSAAIYRFAHEHGFSYGFLCVAFAMLIGWISNFFRRRA